MTAAGPQAGVGRPPRVASVDRLRGLIMALMALDHGANFWSTAVRQNEHWAAGFPIPVEPDEFVVRVVSHLCAPGFFLLMGAGVALSARSRGDGGAGRDGFLLRRGLLLIALQFVVVNLAWLIGSQARPWVVHPGPDGPVWLYFGVLAALGAGLIALVPLMRLPSWALGVGGLALTIGCFVAVPDPSTGPEALPVWQRILWVPGRSGVVMVLYPWLPWLGTAMWGVVLGRMLADDARRTHRWAVALGTLLVVAFVALRLLDAPIDHHARQAGWIGLLNVTKYPPSPAFLMMTLGPLLVLLGVCARGASMTDPLTVFGRAALFFYVVHLYLLGALGHLLPPLGMGATVAVWCVTLVPLWALCRWWGPFKAGRPSGSPIRYL